MNILDRLRLRIQMAYWSWQARRHDAKLQKLIEHARKSGMPTLPDAKELADRAPWPR